MDEEEEECPAQFTCNNSSMEGEAVSWSVSVPRETGLSYWPSGTRDDGTNADLQAELIDADKTEEEVRRRTTCKVHSRHSVAVRGYTRFGGDPTLIPVAVYD